MILFTYFILYFLLVFIVRSLLLWKRTGVNPLTFNKTDDAHGYNGKIYTFISFLEMIVVGVYALKLSGINTYFPFGIWKMIFCLK